MAYIAWLSVFFTLVTISLSRKVTVSVGRPGPTVHESFLGFTTDWWGPNSTMSQKWGNAGSSRFNTSNSALIALVRGLLPATWRTGGTPADCVLYQREDGTWPEGCPGEAHMPVGCPVCLSTARLAELCGFARAVAADGAPRFDWYFGLNAMYGRTSPTSAMNYSQVSSMLSLANKLGCPITNWELGNELVETRKVAPHALGVDITNVAKLIASSPWHTSEKPHLVGIDSSSNAFDLIEQTYRNSSGLTEYTFHTYAANSASSACLPNALASITTVQVVEAAMNGIYSHFSHNISSCGECGSCYDGGGVNASDAFASSFWYLSSLGHASKLGFERFQRSTLIGGDYELIDHDTMMPNPDYYIARLWSSLMGRRAFNSSTNDQWSRAYFHCDRSGRGGLVGALFNADSGSSATFSFPGVSTRGSQVYQVRSANARMDSRVACLVGADGKCNPILFDGVTVPVLDPVSLPQSAQLTLLPQSYAFITFPFANFVACA